MRTLLAGDGEGVCSGVAEGDTDGSGEIEADGDSPGAGDGVGLTDSCASATEAKVAIASTKMAFVVMSRKGETSLIVSMRCLCQQFERFDSLASQWLSLKVSGPSRRFPGCPILNCTRNDRAKHSIASSRSAKYCVAIRSHAETLHRHYV
jgi:hypothetical protein